MNALQQMVCASLAVRISRIIVPAMLIGALVSTARAQTTTSIDPDDVHVHGKVFDPQGKPLAGARVSASPNWPQGTDPAMPQIISTTTSGSDGRFDLTFKKSAASVFNYSAGRSGTDIWKSTHIVAAADGFGLAWKKFDQVDEQGDLTLNLVVDEPIEGRVIDLEGRPIAGVTVKVYDIVNYILAQWSGNENDPKTPPPYDPLRNPPAFSANPAAIVSDADGRFRITGMGRDRHLYLNFQSRKVDVISENVLTRNVPPVVQSPWGPTSTKIINYGSRFEIAVSPTMTIEGTVSDAATRLPLAGVHVGSSHAVVTTVTDARGHYRLEGLRKAHHSLNLTIESEPYIPIAYAEAPNSNGMAPMAPVTLDVQMRKGIWVSGKVTDQTSGAPVPAYVAYWPAASNKAAAAISQFTTLTNSPSYALTAADGSYRLVALPGAGMIVVTSATGLYRTGVGFNQIKEKTPDGRPNLTNRYVTADHENAIKEIDVPESGAVAPVDFQLDRGQTLHIACVDPDGKAIDGLVVLGTKSFNFSGDFQPREQSAFDAPGFAPDETRVILLYNTQKTLGRIIAPRISDIPSQKMTVTLEPLMQVSGRLLDADGDVMKRGVIEGEMQLAAGIRKPSGAVSVEISSDGRFKIGLPVGCDWTVRASDILYDKTQPMIPRLTPKPGETQDVGDFRLRPKREE